MIKMTLSASGIFAFARKPRGQRERDMADMVKQIQYSILSNYASGHMTPSLKDRLLPSGFAVYGLSDRSARYRQRQLRALGVLRPYYSPRRLNFTRLALAATKGNTLAIIKAANQLASFKPHMADLIHKPGIGFNVRQIGGRNVQSVLRYPGARILNKGGSRNEAYRKELTNLNLGGGRDRKALLKELRNRTRESLPLLYARNQRNRVVI